MWTFHSQASPPVTATYPSWRLALPSRRDFTSGPVSETPASSFSSMLYSWKARRFDATGRRPAFLRARRASAFSPCLSMRDFTRRPGSVRSVLDHPLELRRELGVELRTGLRLEDVDGLIVRQHGTVRSRRRHGVERFAQMDDARAERNLVAPDPIGIAAAVPPFVVMLDERGDRVGPGDVLDEEGADARMLAEQRQLLVGERALRVERVVAELAHADVVQDAGHRDLLDFHRRNPDLSGQFPRHAAHVERVRLERRAFLKARLEELVDEPAIRLAEAGLAAVSGEDVPEDDVRRAQGLADLGIRAVAEEQREKHDTLGRAVEDARLDGDDLG